MSRLLKVKLGARTTEATVQVFEGISVVSISVPNLDQARQFYRDILSLGEPVYDLPEAGWIEFKAGRTPGNIAIMKAEDGWKPSTSTTVVFNVKDCHEACRELRQRGVRCDDPVVFPGYVTYCSFYDPFGNRLQMCSPAAAESGTSR
jgi:predicted enzyme related to lactoylglutathione lyase